MIHQFFCILHLKNGHIINRIANIMMTFNKVVSFTSNDQLEYDLGLQEEIEDLAFNTFMDEFDYFHVFA